jgi:hypothetical protein
MAGPGAASQANNNGGQHMDIPHRGDADHGIGEQDEARELYQRRSLFSSNALHNVELIRISQPVLLPSGGWLREVRITCGALTHTVGLFSETQDGLGIVEELAPEKDRQEELF